MKLWKPRTIRAQLLVGLLLLQAISTLVFAVVLMRQQSRENDNRTRQRLIHQAASLALHAGFAISEGSRKQTEEIVSMSAEAPSSSLAQLIDPSGNVLYSNRGIHTSTLPIPELTAQEREAMNRSRTGGTQFLAGKDSGNVAIAPVWNGNSLVGFVLIRADREWDDSALISMLHSIAWYGGIWIIASSLLVLALSRSITKPLRLLLSSTRSIIREENSPYRFPLPVTSQNEVGDLTSAYNLMVTSIEEKQAGLSDTLALLDSMLANAPIGFAFFDAHERFVRVNQYMAEMTGHPIGWLLGRTVGEVLSIDAGLSLAGAIRQVFDSGIPLRDLELKGAMEGMPVSPWTWLTNIYPVRTTSQQVRWVGVVIVDVSERRRSEEALRKNEKLAATGRLAASIAHEINNPLEAVTNLLYLLEQYSDLNSQAANFVKMAQHEVSRVSEITQQTLRFYRQSTLPIQASVSELLDSVIALHQGRLHTLNISVQRDYELNTSLYCLAGELRQVLANLVSNAIDAMSQNGGRLCVRVHRSTDWRTPAGNGVRIVVSDSGCGMDQNTRDHIFEAFFSTKEATGTGLGLWLSHEIIAKHRGRVQVRSRETTPQRPGGTTFLLFFPDNGISGSDPLVEENLDAETIQP